MKNSLFKNILPAFFICISLFLSSKLNGHGYGYIYFTGSFFILACLLFYKLFFSYKNEIIIPRNNYTLFLACFLLWLSLSYLWSPAPSNSLKSILIFFTLAIVLILRIFFLNLDLSTSLLNRIF